MAVAVGVNVAVAVGVNVAVAVGVNVAVGVGVGVNVAVAVAVGVKVAVAVGVNVAVAVGVKVAVAVGVNVAVGVGVNVAVAVAVAVGVGVGVGPKGQKAKPRLSAPLGGSGWMCPTSVLTPVLMSTVSRASLTSDRYICPRAGQYPMANASGADVPIGVTVQVSTSTLSKIAVVSPDE